MSMEIVLIILLIVVICGIGVVLFVFLQKFNEIKNTNAVELMKTDVTELSRSIMSLQQTMGDKLEKSKAVNRKCKVGGRCDSAFGAAG